ncbi:hypothetical protein [Aeromonas salmonicida]|uniref:hypothetical protein n=1 Tax=Aeromonas salmonicida TaxID=645 RepID=UPI0015E08FC7|nr:hypothetical protein [Aeromonas salmonicida]
MVQEVIGKIGIVVHGAVSLTQNKGRYPITRLGIFLTVPTGNIKKPGVMAGLV